MEITTRKYVEIQQMVIIFFVPEEKEGTTEKQKKEARFKKASAYIKSQKLTDW